MLRDGGVHSVNVSKQHSHISVNTHNRHERGSEIIIHYVGRDVKRFILKDSRLASVTYYCCPLLVRSEKNCKLITYCFVTVFALFLSMSRIFCSSDLLPAFLCLPTICSYLISLMVHNANAFCMSCLPLFLLLLSSFGT